MLLYKSTLIPPFLFITEAAITILRIDDLIKLEPESGKENAYQQAYQSANLMVKFLRKKAEKNSFLQGVSLIIVAKQTAVGHPVYVCMIIGSY